MINTTNVHEVLEVCRLIYDRFLTNAAGGNFSIRASTDTLYISVAGNAKRNRLRMTPDDLLLVDLHGKIFEGKGEPSSLWLTHRFMYQAFDFVGTVIHAHPRMATAFACRNKPMPPLIAAMKKYGEIPVIPSDIDLFSEECAKAIADIFEAKGKSFEKHGHAVFYPYHGILVVAPTLDDAYDLLERIEFNAYAILANCILDIASFDATGKKNVQI